MNVLEPKFAWNVTNVVEMLWVGPGKLLKCRVILVGMSWNVTLLSCWLRLIIVGRVLDLECCPELNDAEM